ncbi:MAG: type VII toxin-antitoxin system MntA family adenylyltransferase antitoxin [Bacteroidales bacterium]
MIKEEKLPDHILDKIPGLVERLKKEKDLEAFYIYGSGARNELKPLSDLDFAILLDMSSIQKELFRRELDYRVYITDYLHSEEFDLILLNRAPLRFAHSVLREGKLLYCKNTTAVINFSEYINKHYLDFKFHKSEFDRIFQEELDHRYG